MTPRQHIFYDDMRSDLRFMGTVPFNSQLPEYPSGSFVLCPLIAANGALQALYILFRGNSGMWHEFEPHPSYLLKQWLELENRKYLIQRSDKFNDYRPWEDVTNKRNQSGRSE